MSVSIVAARDSSVMLSAAVHVRLQLASSQLAFSRAEVAL